MLTLLAMIGLFLLVLGLVIVLLMGMFFSSDMGGIFVMVRLITMMPTVELLSQAALLRLRQTNGLISILMAKPLKASGLSMARNTTLTKMVSNTRARPLRSAVVTSTMTKTMANL